MVLKLPFISCPCFLQSPRLVCLQILIGSHLLGCLILFFSNPGHQITALRRASTLSVRSHGNSFLPKCPKAAVCRKIGQVRRRLSTICFESAQTPAGLPAPDSHRRTPSRTKRIHLHHDRLGNPNGIGQRHLTSAGKSRSDNVLGNVSGHIRYRTVYF